MTLVVARISQGVIAIASDTRITKQGLPLPHQEGIIKSCLLPGGLCVSFANSPELAARDFIEFAKKYPEGTGFDDAVAYFEKSSADTGNDYILACSQDLKLLKIADGKRVTSIASTQWIGDASAYSRFREYEGGRRKTESGRALNTVVFADEMDGSPASNLYSVMRHVVNDREIQSTGGFVCVVSSREEHFRHSVYSDMLYNWPEAEEEEFILSLDDQIDLGASGENRGYAVSQISTGFLDLNAVAFYLVRAKKIFVFYGNYIGIADKCIVFQNIEPSQISSKLDDLFQVDLRWLMLVTSSPISTTKTQHRSPLFVEQPKGVRLSFFVHANTLSKPHN